MGTRKQGTRRTRKRDTHAAALVHEAILAAQVADGGLEEWRQAIERVIESGAGAFVVGDAANDVRSGTADIVALRQETRSLVDALIQLHDDHEEGLLPKVTVTDLEFSADSSTEHVLLVIDGPARTVFWFQFMALLRQVGLDRLDRCEVCGRVFVRGREFRRACSTKCQAAVRLRENRERQAKRRREKRDDVREAKHRAYVRKFQRQHPKAKAKPSRRKRGISSQRHVHKGEQ